MKDPIAIVRNTYNYQLDISEDQRLKAVLNPYTYTDNNPINYTDPTGLARWHFDYTRAGERLIHYGRYRFNRLGQLVEHSGKIIEDVSCDAQKTLDWLRKVKPDFFRACQLFLLPGQEQGLNNFSRTGSFTTNPHEVY